MLIQHNQSGGRFYFDNRLFENLINIRHKVINKDFDWTFLVVGNEGYGKSVLAMQLAYICAGGDFELNDTCFSLEEFKNRIIYHHEHNNKGRSVIFDETMGTSDARSFNTTINKQLLRILSQSRQFNLHLFILLPSFFDIDKPISLRRARSLIRVDVEKKTYERGKFYFYNQKKMLRLYLKGKSNYEYKAKPSFFGRFRGFYVIDEKEYRERKVAAFNIPLAVQKKSFKEVMDEKWKERLSKALFLLNKELKISQYIISDKIGMPRTMINEMILKLEKQKPNNNLNLPKIS